MNLIHTFLRRLWNYLREVSGENDYARYSERARRLGAPLLTRQEFYLEQLERKHSRPTRCC
jgi:uncharacterized short protein YbdD (DUF466 family)